MTSPALSVVGLQAGYGKRLVLSRIDLTVEHGEWCTLLGPNGVGKTTLLQAIAGQVAVRAGTIKVSGYALATHRTQALRAIGVACSPDRLPGLLTGRQCLQVYAAAKECESIDTAVLELADALRFTRYLDVFVDTYSLGTRQKLCVLLGLIGEPSLLILDEAFNGLDPASGLVLKHYLRDRVTAGSLSVLLATHALDIVEHFSDTAALLWEGRIVRAWDASALKVLREGEDEAFESELARAITEGTVEPSIPSV